MATLNEFGAQIRKGNVSRPYLYYIELTTPPVLASTSTDTIRLVNLFCHGASTPMLSLYTNDDYNEAGIRRKFVYEYDYQNLMLQFYLDQNYEVKNFFDNWMKSIVGNKRNFQYPDTYTADKLQLHIVNMENQITYTYTYNRVFPKSVHAIDLSYASVGQVSTFPVEFVFETVEFSTSTIGTNTTVTQDVSTLNEYTIAGNSNGISDSGLTLPGGQVMSAALSDLNKEVIQRLNQTGNVTSIDYAGALTNQSYAALSQFNPPALDSIGSNISSFFG